MNRGSACLTSLPACWMILLLSWGQLGCELLLPAVPVDNDHDGYYDCSDDDPDKAWCDPADCDDSNAGVYPGATEVPYDGLDQDCVSGDRTDLDGDGYDAIAAQGGTDCDDQDASIHPGAPEQLDEVDSDCNGYVDAIDRIAGFDWTACDEGCPQAEGRLYYPTYLALDPVTGAVFITTNDERVWRLEDGRLEVFAGRGARGRSPEGVLAREASFDGASGIVVGAGADRGLYLADYFNRRVIRFDLDEPDPVVEEVATVGDASLKDGEFALGGLPGDPIDVAVDNFGALYVAIYDGRVVQVRGGRVYAFAGSSSGQPCPPGCDDPRSFPLEGPYGLHFEGERLFIADHSSRIAQVDAVDHDGYLEPAAISMAVGQACGLECAAGPELAGGFSPRGLAIREEMLYFTSSSVSALYEVPLDAGPGTMVGEPIVGAAGYEGVDDGVGGAARFHIPLDLLFEPSGALLVADKENCLIRSVNLDDPRGPRVSSPIGATVSGLNDAPYAIDALLKRPGGLVLDRDGRILMADTGNNVVHRIDFAPGAPVISRVAGTGEVGGTTDGVATGATLFSPEDVAVGDADGIETNADDVFIADRLNGCVRRIDAGNRITVLAPDDALYPNGLETISPYGLHWTADGLLVVDRERCMVLRWRPAASGAHWDLVAGTVDGCRDTDDPDDDGRPATEARLRAPLDVIQVPDGRIFISEALPARIRVIQDGIIGTVAIAPDLEGAYAGQLAWDERFGTLWVTSGDSSHSFLSRLTGLDEGSDVSIEIVMENGMWGYGADTGTIHDVLPNLGNLAGGLAVDPDGTVYLSDTYNHRLLRIRL